ncbi:MBOAT family O-acyltransferase [Longitalea arenae]|uniref:MBOAT family O-acyltransferase n=1 Tax=Longitalea arenae TaxID=2812558 RepID=UPI001967A4E0
MLFNSFEFLLFLPTVFILYWFVFNRSVRWQNLLVLLASYFFYGWWSWQFLILLGASTLLDYLYGFAVASPNKKKAKLFLWLSIINNLGILAVFKYYNFFVTQFQQAFELLSLHFNPVLLQVAIPIGISFYTFHGMSYIFDIYRQQQQPVKNFVDYAVFVSFFPLLVAGPIERANHLLPQIQRKRSFDYMQAVVGCRLILWGLFKKVVIADSLAAIADNIFSNYQDQNTVSLIIGAIAFSFQIYGDFSGYSDIALGTARLFGFELLSNFRFPYFSRDIAEFWRRWHISLSSWFRDYVYIPLGGSKQGTLKAVRNTFIIFLISGFWHGASWNFIAWGFIHACGFLPLLLLGRNRRHSSDVVAQYGKYPSLKECWQMGTTFAFVSVAWVFFRAHDMKQALGYLKGIITNYKQPLACNPTLFYYIIPLLAGDWWLRRDERNLKMPRKYKSIIYIIVAISIIFYFGKKTNFIYFQF